MVLNEDLVDEIPESVGYKQGKVNHHRESVHFFFLSKEKYNIIETENSTWCL